MREEELDFLKELSNVGAGHAATALSQLINRQVGIRVPNVSAVDITEVPDLIGGVEAPVSGVLFDISGDVRGVIILLLSEESSKKLVRLLLPDQESHVSELGISSIMEVGNIIISAFLSVMGDMLSLKLLPSVPYFANDMMGAVIDNVLIKIGSESDAAFVCETQFYDIGNDIKGHIFLMPDPHSLKIIMTSLQNTK